MVQKNNRRYAAMLLFQFRVAGSAEKRRLCEKRLVLFRAVNIRAAIRAAKRRGRDAQHTYLNGDGAEVCFEFIGIEDLLHLGTECEPDEVWYEFQLRKQPMERRDRILRPESRFRD